MAKVRMEELEAGERVAQLDHAWKLAQSRLHRARARDLPVASSANGASR